MKRYYKVLAALVLSSLLLSCTEKSQDSQTESTAALQFASPEEVGLAADSLAKIDKMIMSYVEKGRFPGAVVLIAKAGKIVYETEVGWSDSLRQQPYTKESLFRMASMTKPYTSVAAMQLYEKGLLKLDDPISKYIPNLNPKHSVQLSGLTLPINTRWHSSLGSCLQSRQDNTVFQFYYPTQDIIILNIKQP